MYFCVLLWLPQTIFFIEGSKCIYSYKYMRKTISKRHEAQHMRHGSAKKYRLLVSFDIHGAKAGDRRYRKVDQLLKSVGTVISVFKQVRLVSTSYRAQLLAPMITKIIGTKGGVLILQAAKPYRFVLGKDHMKAASRPEVRDWFLGV